MGPNIPKNGELKAAQQLGYGRPFECIVARPSDTNRWHLKLLS